MRASIHQPNYLPWRGYFDKIKRSDVFVFLDQAQYSKNDFHNRNKIKTSQGFAYLTIPIEKTEHFKPLCQVKLPSNSSWQKKHWKAICLSYQKAPYFAEHRPFFEKIYQAEEQFLIELNIKIIEYLKESFGFKAELVRESSLGLDSSLKASERLLAVLKKIGAEEYLSGRSGQHYLDLNLFSKEGIKVKFQDYQPQAYSQLFGPFLSGLSAVDLLFNQGPKAGGII